ncbi:hypothetical protein BFJ71_g4790 [Fusarium oxysporum]|nr:hypothetical protein BFJ71_g4790 [Fusarium oxysporum]
MTPTQCTPPVPVHSLSRSPNHSHSDQEIPGHYTLTFDEIDSSLTWAT